MKDPYRVLGISKNASMEDIKSAYRKMARQNHPDLHQGDSRAEERFKEIQQAYQLLSDETKKAQFDRGQIDAEGNPTFRSGGFAGGGGRRSGARGGSGGGSFHDIFKDFANSARGRRFNMDDDDPFANMYGGGFGGAGGFGSGDFGEETHPKKKGATVNCWVELDFVEAARGCKKNVRLPTGKELNVNIPAGFEDGQTLRLKGQGMPGLNGAPSGDAMVEIHVKPDPMFSRKGNDVHLDLPITVPEAVMGAKIEAPTIDGAVNVKIPEGANSGTTLRLRAKGIEAKDGTRGDQYVKLRVMLPEKSDQEFRDFVKKWAKKSDYSVRPKK